MTPGNVFLNFGYISIISAVATTAHPDIIQPEAIVQLKQITLPYDSILLSIR